MNDFRDVRMELMSSRAVQAYLKNNDLIILPVGCTEMHGPQIPLGCDTLLDTAVAYLAARELNCLCAPTIPYSFPAASAPWPGTVNISTQVTMDYVTAVIEALHAGGFNRVLLMASHGPWGEMGKCVSREIFRKTGKVVPHIAPLWTLQDRFKEKGIPAMEDGVILGALEILGYHGVYNPETKEEGPLEFPSELIGPLKKLGLSVPWLFGKDYQHTGIRKTLSYDNLPAILETIHELVKEMKDIPALFAAYQQEMDTLNRERPWDREDIWTKTD